MFRVHAAPHWDWAAAEAVKRVRRREM